MSSEPTADELAVLGATLGNDETYKEKIAEYAVVYYRRGKLTAEGPYEDRHVAERKAKGKGGVVAKRVVTRSWGRWTSLSEEG